MFWIMLTLKCLAVVALGGLVIGAAGAGTGWTSHVATLGMVVTLIWVVRTDLAKRRG